LNERLGGMATAAGQGFRRKLIPMARGGSPNGGCQSCSSHFLKLALHVNTPGRAGGLIL